MIEYENSPPWLRELARESYEAYTANSGGKAWDGRPCPTWTELLSNRSPVCSHWCAAAATAVRGTVKLINAATVDRIPQ